MAVRMGTSVTLPASKIASAAKSVAVERAEAQAVPENLVHAHAMISTELPVELRQSAHELLRAIQMKVGVAEHFDAFCGLAFSKPEWAAAASPVIAEIFDQDEDLLAELSRIPDLVIELGSGQATVTCMVASRWAARGETHRLSRLAESIVASHASKNACSVEVMLALAATLAVTRLSRGEQLYNAALPLAGPEHQEAIIDAKRWLAAGRIVCSASHEERDFWDLRLRKPRVAWSWQSKEERLALDTLSERLSADVEGAELFRAVLPPCWWDLAQKCVRQQEGLATVQRQVDELKTAVHAVPSSVPARVPMEPTPERHIQDSAVLRSSSRIRVFVLGWVCGALAMAVSVFLLPSEVVQHVFGVANNETHDQPGSAKRGGAPKEIPSVSEREAWRKENLRRMAEDMASYESLFRTAKVGTWTENERVLSGLSEEMPQESSQYMKLLVWLHLDPPGDSELRQRVPRLLLQRVGADAISLWEELVYPGSSNASEICDTVRSALNDGAFHWTEAEKRRLQQIVESELSGNGKSAALAE